MNRSRFTEAQIAFILRQGEEGTAVGEICRKAGIGEATDFPSDSANLAEVRSPSWRLAGSGQGRYLDH